MSARRDVKRLRAIRIPPIKYPYPFSARNVLSSRKVKLLCHKTMCFRLHFWQSVFGVHYPVKHTKSVSEKRKALLFTDTLPRPGSQSMCIYLVPDLLSAYPSELVKPFRADAISTSVLRRIRVSAPNAITGSGSLQPRPSARRV